MFARLFRRGPSPRAAGAQMRRPAAVMAALTCGLLAWAAAVPAAAAMAPTPQRYPRGEYGPGPVAPVPATPRVIIAGACPAGRPP